MQEILFDLFLRICHFILHNMDDENKKNRYIRNILIGIFVLVRNTKFLRDVIEHNYFPRLANVRCY